MSFRRAGRMHHLGIGATHARKRVLAIADDTTITVIELDTGEILSTHTIDPTKTYWRNTQEPRADGPELDDSDLCRDSGVTHVATHHNVELRGLEPLTPCMPCRCATSCATAP
jgi:hypothetical protein